MAKANPLLPPSRILPNSWAKPVLVHAFPASCNAMTVSAFRVNLRNAAASSALRLSTLAAWLSAVSPHSTGEKPRRRPAASKRSRYRSNNIRSGPSLRRPTAAMTTRMARRPCCQKRTPRLGKPAAELVRRRIARALGRPHLLKIIKLAHLRAKHVHDDVGGVDQHPVALGLPLDARATIAGIFQLVLQLLGDRAHMPV